ncbi:MAG: hypothetical protein PSY12_14235 [bacterium]|nr:hypothetical protein [bacterium]
MSLELGHVPSRNQSTLDERSHVSSNAPSGAASGIGCAALVAALIYSGSGKPKRPNLRNLA